MPGDSGTLFGSCLCGQVSYRSSQAHSEMFNCHCRACRKASSVAYGTWIRARPESFSWLSGESKLAYYHSSATMRRSFCSNCGSIGPAHSEGDGCVLLPAGGITTAHSLTPSGDRCTDQLPGWYKLDKHMPRRAGAPVHETPLQGSHAGSCLCGAIHYRVSGEADAIRACHCSRCRQRSGSGCFTCMPVQFTEFQLEGDEDGITSFSLPSSQYYAYRFCSGCGTLVPNVLPGGGRVAIAAGSLDSAPPVGLLFHIYSDSRAPWMKLHDNEYCFGEYPPADFDWNTLMRKLQ